MLGKQPAYCVVEVSEESDDMAPVLEVDVNALNADGGRLESLGRPFSQSNCAPPGSDAVSLGAARSLNAHEMALDAAASEGTGSDEYRDAMSRYADLVKKAEEAAKQYHSSVSSAVTSIGFPIVPCPPIASKADIPVPGQPQLGPGVKLAPETPLIVSRSQLEKKFDKHAEDFGVTAPRGREGFDEFERALLSQIQNPATLHIDGTYRGEPAIINYNPNTGLAVIQKPSGEFVSGWRLSPEQAKNVLQRGSLR